MFEQIDQLAERVETLVRLLEESRNDADLARDQARQLQRQLDAKAEVEAENGRLHEQIERLDATVAELNREKTQARERLMGMLGRLDSLENEIRQGGAQG